MRTRPSPAIGVRSRASRIDPKRRIFGSTSADGTGGRGGSGGTIGCAPPAFSACNSGEVEPRGFEASSISPEEAPASFVCGASSDYASTFHSAAQTPTATSSAASTQVWLLVPVRTPAEPEGALAGADTRSLFPCRGGGTSAPTPPSLPRPSLVETGHPSGLGDHVARPQRPS